MIGGVQNIGRITELRQRVLFTFAMLGVYRIGAFIVTPGIDPDGNVRSRPGRKMLLTFRSSYAVAEGGRVIFRIENVLDDEYYDSEVGPMGLGIGFYGGLTWEF